MDEKPKIVSACLAGVLCRYDCGTRPEQDIIELVRNGKAIPVCPEQLGGMSTPRPPSEEVDGKFITVDGEDVTENYYRGAKEALKIAKMSGCDEAFLKSKSPMCGVDEIYSGKFDGTMIKGDGLFVRMLKEAGIKVTKLDGDDSSLMKEGFEKWDGCYDTDYTYELLMWNDSTVMCYGKDGMFWSFDSDMFYKKEDFNGIRLVSTDPDYERPKE